MKKIGLFSDFGVQPFLVIFELPHLKVNHEQKYTFLRTADIYTFFNKPEEDLRQMLMEVAEPPPNEELNV